MLLRSLLLVATLLVASVWAQSKKCTATNCQQPKCYCRDERIPFVNITNAADVPQFVMLTFDDAVGQSNIEFYEQLLTKERKNPGRGCPIRATFFVTHEYTNYVMVNKLYREGHEIASHSITHTSLTDKWREKNEAEWKAEMDGLRDMAAKYGLIPKNKILGTRAPFLQTSGDPLFSMLKKNGFLYDSSMPTRLYSANKTTWPYTLDHGYDQDCIIAPCPKGNYSGIWEVPLIMMWKMRDVAGVHELYPCAMADACLPLPESAKDTEEYLYENFNRHYTKNKAPFPVFIHESWLKHAGRKQGYMQFVERLRRNHKDVFFVTVQDVIRYMLNPIPLKSYNNQACPVVTDGGDCRGRVCNFKVGPEEWETRRMDSCVDCPDEDSYPWLEKIEG